MFLPKHFRPGPGLSNAEYAPLAEVMGRGMLASEACNCSAPDTGNMEVLIKYGSAEQKKRWLEPLLAGQIRSAFLMTEPAVASSDARNVCTDFRRQPGGGYRVTGRKWWSTGAMHPHCKVYFVLGKCSGGAEQASAPTHGSTGAQGPSSARHREHSILVVPADARGVRIVRPLTAFGYDDAPVGHAEVALDGVAVGPEAVVLGEGRGFEIAQGRLGPGRIHHCMRAVGLGERALEMMVRRALGRKAFGKRLVRHGTVARDIAESRIDLETARLLVLRCAALVDAVGGRGARKEVALIKVAVPRLVLRVIDRAIQVFGGAGVEGDGPLARAFAGIRSLRIADGPDEVHARTVAGLEVRDMIKRRVAKL